MARVRTSSGCMCRKLAASLRLKVFNSWPKEVRDTLRTCTMRLCLRLNPLIGNAPERGDQRTRCEDGSNPLGVAGISVRQGRQVQAA